MKMCKGCGSLIPPRYEACPKCGGVIFGYQQLKNVREIPQEIKEPISSLVSHSASNIWMNVSGL